MPKRTTLSAFAFASFVILAPLPAAAVSISVGAYPELNPSPSISIPVNTFLVPVRISGATNLQDWQFDLLFDNTVVEEVDPLDGSAGIYGAEFLPGDSTSQSFILGGFPFNSLGLVDDVVGFFPLLLSAPSGDGVLAYVLFQFLPDQETSNPDFRVENATVVPVPDPGALALVSGGLAMLLGVQRQARCRKRYGF